MHDVKKKIFIFLFDGFADWEISYLTPEINKSQKFELVFFSKNGEAITSMGGLQIKPESSRNQLKMNEVDMLILPGGTAWEKGENFEIERLTLEVFKKGKPIAAICAATVFLGQLGLLDDLKHTSNDLKYLQSVAPNYHGEKNYQNSLAMRDGNIITANGVAPIEFAREIFSTIGLYTDEEIEKWFQLFKNGIWSD